MNMNQIKAVILDWAGTTVDYGCFAPVNAFISAFETFGVTPTMDETRAPMGMPKRAHIEKMLEGKRISALWHEKYNRQYTQEDVDKIYSQFEPELFKTLASHTDLLPGVLDAVAKIRRMGIVIGSTTGYTQKMMDVVVPLAKEKGYSPDCVICPDETCIGRPFPYMIWRNLEKLRISSISEVIKIGDTTADMQEGKNAGCLCVGVLEGSSMLGLAEKEVMGMEQAQLQSLFETATQNYIKAGADYVIRNITELPELINTFTSVAVN